MTVSESSKHKANNRDAKQGFPFSLVFFYFTIQEYYKKGANKVVLHKYKNYLKYQKVAKSEIIIGWPKIELSASPPDGGGIRGAS